MRPPGYGETQPRLDDDRLPVVLVVLDGLGDRPVPELGGRTPSEAARDPRTSTRWPARGASGWHLPFGWGRAPASELAHWAMFGVRRRPVPRARGARGARRGRRRAGRGRGHPRRPADVAHADDDGAGVDHRAGRARRRPTTRRALLDALAALARRHDAHLAPARRPGRGAARADRRTRAAPSPTPTRSSRTATPGCGCGRWPRSPGPRRPLRPWTTLLLEARRDLRAHPVNRARTDARPPGAGRAHDEVVGRAVGDPVVHRAERRRRRRGDQHRALPGPRPPRSAWRRATCDPASDVTAPTSAAGWPPRTS